MNSLKSHSYLAAALLPALLAVSAANANAYRESGKTVEVAKSAMSVTPPRDWNRLDVRAGKNAETWTLDGELLNDVTFYGGIEPGQPLVKERNKKRDPLPKFSKSTLLVEIPELLEGTYRAYKKIGVFELTETEPATFLGTQGVRFSYQFVDQDGLTRKGEAHAALIDGRLYMVTFDAPRLHYFDQTISDFRNLVATAKLS